MKISFASVDLSKADILVIGIYEGNKLSSLAKDLDKKTGGALAKAMKSGTFKGKTGQYLAIPSPAKVSQSLIVLAGLGKEKELDALSAEKAAGGLVSYLNGYGVKQAAIAVEACKSLSAEEAAAHMAMALKLRSYDFHKYFTKKKDEDKPTFTGATLMVEKPAQARKRWAELDKVSDGVLFTRDLVTEPSNVIYPKTLAEQCKTLADLGVEITVLNETQMKKLGMGSLLAVGQGSEHESYLVVMRWNGAGKKSEKPVAFVGKGVTFDTGGISLKPSAGMEEMKYDMGGSGVVIGLMKALAGRKARVNAVGVVGLVENMPSGKAQRPGDVVKSMSGQTIEVLNTDAEGRLVLADALWYTKEKLKPRFIIDLATLTGAIVITLGESRAGLFSHDDKLADQIFECGGETGEPVWRLPLGEEYDKQIDSDIADMKNIGEGRLAGSITAAQFLKRFVGDLPWAHLDIAGVTWNKKGSHLAPQGATGFGVRLLDQLVRKYYEGK